MTPEKLAELTTGLRELPPGGDVQTAWEKLCPDNVPIDVFLTVWQATRQDGFTEILNAISTVADNPKLANLPPKQLHRKLFPDTVSLEDFRNLFLEIHGGEPVPEPANVDTATETDTEE